MTVVAIVCALFSGCKKSVDNKDMIRFQELTRQYVTEELHIANVDSVCVVKVDTVNNYEYAQIVVELLRQMNEDLLSEYSSLLLSGDTVASRDVEIQLDEIAAAGEQWEMEVQATENAPKTMRFYLLTANYYAGNEIDQFYFLVTPDFKIHILDPFEEL